MENRETRSPSSALQKFLFQKIIDTSITFFSFLYFVGKNYFVAVSRSQFFLTILNNFFGFLKFLAISSNENDYRTDCLIRYILTVSLDPSTTSFLPVNESSDAEFRSRARRQFESSQSTRKQRNVEGRRGEWSKEGGRRSVEGGGNFSGVTGFMSFPPFGGFHFQSGPLELVIQTRSSNERKPSSSSSSSSTSSPTFLQPPSARNSRRLAPSSASGFPTDLALFPSHSGPAATR